MRLRSPATLVIRFKTGQETISSQENVYFNQLALVITDLVWQLEPRVILNSTPEHASLISRPVLSASQ